MNNGTLLISLDFELFWGVRDCTSLNKYGKRILMARKAVVRMLELFEEYDIHATFAIVGFLFFDSKKELEMNIPKSIPCYKNKSLSPYGNYLKTQVGDSEEKDQYHFASTLVSLINSHKEHEIATHTYSHFYCREEGQTREDFKADLEIACDIAYQKTGKRLKSIVFPRNMYNKDYLSVCKKMGIEIVRGNPCNFYQQSGSGMNRLLRFIDTYVNLSGHNTYSYDSIKASSLVYNMPSSSFFRPYNSGLSFCEQMKILRIKKSMTHAAKHNQVYHLWWHPHNFGTNYSRNIEQLRLILIHYKKLNQLYGFQSVTMTELLEKIK